jgi:glutathione S-transferase
VVEVNLMKGAQREAAYRAVNPMMALPALIDGEGPILFESLAIIEYLDETHPNPPLSRATLGAARVCGASHRSSPVIHTR